MIRRPTLTDSTRNSGASEGGSVPCNTSGEIFSFARLDALFCSRPNAAEATEAAVNFGQDDDITVLTLTRLATGARSTTELTTPSFAPA